MYSKKLYCGRPQYKSPKDSNRACGKCRGNGEVWQELNGVLYSKEKCSECIGRKGRTCADKNRYPNGHDCRTCACHWCHNNRTIDRILEAKRAEAKRLQE